MIKHLQKIISFVLIVIIVLSLFETRYIVDASDELVEVKITAQKDIDILLTAGRTSTDFSNFKKDILKALEDRGIDSSRVNITSTNTTQLDVQRSFDWTWKWNCANSINQYTTYSAISNYRVGSFTQDRNNVIIRGNWVAPGKQILYTNPKVTNSYLDEISFNYALDYEDNISTGGVFVGGSINGTKLTGYFVALVNSYEISYPKYYSFMVGKDSHGSYGENHYWSPYCLFSRTCTHGYDTYVQQLWGDSSNGHTGAIFKVTWDLVDNVNNLPINDPTLHGNYKLLSAFDAPYSGNMKISATHDDVTVFIDNKKMASASMGEDSGKIWGFFSEHFPHNCNHVGTFTLSNIEIQQSSTKLYSEVVHGDNKWREDALHCIVNIEDYENESLTIENAETLANTLADDVHFIQWGNEKNETQVNEFIKANDNKGTFIESKDGYADEIEQTADYIATLLIQESELQQILIGQRIIISVLPEMYAHNAVSDKFKNGRWMIHHDYTYYDNNMGQSTQTEVYTKDLSCNFDKTGKYDIYFDDKLVKTVYAHRAPVADFSIKILGTNLELQSESYDLDTSINIGYGDGIYKETWYYKEPNATEWTKGKLTAFDKDKIYLIKLEVQDRQGAIESTVKYIGTGDPVAKFNLKSNIISKYGNLDIRDTSYDPQGLEITKRTWVLKSGDNQIAKSTDEIPSFDFKTIGIGEYVLSLTVTNSEGKTSEAYIRDFSVVNDYYQSEVIITPTYCNNKETQDITLEFRDLDSGFSKWRYAFTTEQNPPETGWSEYKTTTTDTITINTDGNWYLHLQAYDLDGNLMKRTVGLYKIRHDYTNTYKHVLFGFKNNEGNYSNSQGYLLNDLQEDVTWGEQIIPNERKQITIPNGCYAVQKYGTSDISGTYTMYNYGTEVTQGSKGLTFQMDYYPTEYTITYDLAGGKLNGSIPAKYTVLYGVTYDEPYRVGYTFQGWYDQNGNKVTGVNEGKNATFASAEEIYQELATRQTGNIQLTARWEINELPLAVTANNTVNNNKGAVTLDWTNYNEEKAVYKTYKHDERQGENEYAQMTYVTQPTAVKILVDTEGKDVKAPTKPVIELIAKNVYSYSSIDRGSTYKYYVESYDPDDTDDRVQISNIAETTVESGFKEYRYLFDDDENTVLTATSGKSTTEESIRFTRELKYLHIAGVDKAGNVSETATVEIQQYQDYTVNYYLQNLDGQTYTLDRSVTRNAFIGTDTISELIDHDGFTTPEEQVEQVDVDVVVINYYYERNKYTIGLEKVEGVNSISGAGTYYYGEEVTIDAEVDDRYQWINWTGSETIDEKTHTIIVPSTNLLYTANALLKTKVEVKFIDKNTGEELAESIVHKGLYGDQYDVTEDELEIPEFTMIEAPIKTGTMVHAEKILIYYYAKTQKITVKHIEKDTGDKLAEDDVLVFYENKKYHTNQKEIPGYTSVSIAGLFEGTMPRKDLTVVYYYLKDTSVLIQYIDKNTGEELENSVLYTGLYGETFKTTEELKNFEGYTLIESPEAKIKMEKEPKILIFGYARTSRIIVDYIEKTTERKLLEQEISGYEGKEYATAHKEFEGYTLTNTEGELEGIMTGETTRIKYYYLKNTIVEVNYKDKNTGDSLKQSVVHKGLFGDSFDISKDIQAIAGYTLIEEPQKTGIMDQVRKILTYKYAKNTEMKIRFVEENTGKDLLPMKIIKGYEGKVFEETTPEIAGYTLVEDPVINSGLMDRNPQELNFYYLKNTSVKVQYINKKTGEEISESVVHQGLYGEHYDVSKDKKEIRGYKIVEEPKATGNMEENEIVLTYYYVESKILKTRFIDMHPEEHLVSAGGEKTEKQEETKIEIFEIENNILERNIVEEIILKEIAEELTVQAENNNTNSVTETSNSVIEENTQEKEENIQVIEKIEINKQTNEKTNNRNNTQIAIVATNNLILAISIIVIIKTLL